MRKLLIVSLLALSSCAGTVTIPDPAIQSDIERARVIVRQYCGYVPTIEAILAVFSSNPNLQTAQNYVNTFCSLAQMRRLRQTKLYNKYRRLAR